LIRPTDGDPILAPSVHESQHLPSTGNPPAASHAGPFDQRPAAVNGRRSLTLHLASLLAVVAHCGPGLKPVPHAR
jgi:hypothetical protein